MKLEHVLGISKRAKLSASHETGVAIANAGRFLPPFRCVTPLEGNPPAGRLPIKGAATEREVMHG